MDTTTWILAILAGLAIAVLAAILWGRLATQRREAREEQAAQTGPTPDGPGYEDGDPMPHERVIDAGQGLRPFGDYPTAPRVGPPIRSNRPITDQPLRDRARREGREYRPRMYDPRVEDRAGVGRPEFDPASPYYTGTYSNTGSVDTPNEPSAPDVPAPKWGGYEGGGYSSGHGSSGHGSSDSGSSGGSSYSGGSDSGGSSGGSSGGGGGE